jgi:protein-disulfide isomerase
VRAAVVVSALVLAAACDRDDGGARRHRELAERLDDVAAEARAVSARVDQVAALTRKVDDLAAQIAELERKLDAASTAARPAPTTPRRRPSPDPRDVYAVPIAGDPSVGPADALVTIVEGYEYACPFCERVRATLAELRRRYPNEVRIVYKQFVIHPQIATDAALAACAAHRQGKFAAMNDLIWDKGWNDSRNLSVARLEELAKQAGLAIGQFRDDMGHECRAMVSRDQQELHQVGVTGTPTFFINGRYLSGAQPVEAFARVIEEELALANQRLAAGARRRDYYQVHVLDAGLPRFTPPP